MTIVQNSPTVTSGIKNFQIASFGASGGITYLVNVLLELGFHTYAAHMGPWFDREKKEISLDTIQLRQAHALPYLQRRPLTPPSRAVDIAYSHQWPTPLYTIFPTIILHRDPRQTMFSQWRRVNAKWFRGSFLDFLSEPYYYLGMSPVDEWLLWHILWRTIVAPQKYFIKFELSKTQPRQEVGRLLSWIGENVAEQEILKAINRSSYDAVKSSDPNGNILTAGNLDDYKTKVRPDDMAPIDKHCVALYENEKIPEGATSIIASVNLLQERFGRLSSSEYESMLCHGSFYDLRSALRKTKRKPYSDLMLAEAIQKTEKFMTTSVFHGLMNLMDPNAKIVLASMLFVFSQSDYPELIHPKSTTAKLTQKRKKITRLLTQRIESVFN
jgi:hypothetical protein